MIDVRCAQCGTQFRLGDECAGRKAKCPTCGNVQAVPSAPAPAEAGPTARPAPPPPTPGRAPPSMSPLEIRRLAALPDPDFSVRVAAGDEPPQAPSKPAAEEPPRAQTRTARKPAVPPPLPAASPPAVEKPAAPPLGPVRAVPEGLLRRRRRRLPRPVLVAAASAGAVVLVLILVILTRPDERPADPGLLSDAAGPGESSPAKRLPADGKEKPAAGPAEPRVAAPKGENEIEEPPPRTKAPRKAPGAEPVGLPQVGPDPPEPPVTRRKGSDSGPRIGTELTGMSRRYDNLECQQIQARHAIRVPAGATILEVDGRRLAVARPGVLASAPAPYLFLPRGSHAVCFRPSEYPVPATIKGDLVEQYEAMRRFFGVGGTVKMTELVVRAAKTMDTHGAPFLVSFTGAHYAAAGQWDVAERKFRRALAINPAFSPAHLNLAECLSRRKARDEAVREVLLADAFNVGNVFGLAGAIAECRRRLAVPAEAGDPIDLSAVSYVTSEPQTEEDRRLTAILEGLSKYAVRDEDRAKILNNLAIHFADSGRPELALHHFHQSLSVVLHAGEGRYDLARKVFGNIKTVCRKAGFAEADEYGQMETMVLQ